MKIAVIISSIDLNFGNENEVAMNARRAEMNRKMNRKMNRYVNSKNYRFEAGRSCGPEVKILRF